MPNYIKLIFFNVYSGPLWIINKEDRIAVQLDKNVYQITPLNTRMININENYCDYIWIPIPNFLYESKKEHLQCKLQNKYEYELVYKKDNIENVLEKFKVRGDWSYFDSDFDFTQKTIKWDFMYHIKWKSHFDKNNESITKIRHRNINFKTLSEINRTHDFVFKDWLHWKYNFEDMESDCIFKFK